MTRKLIITLLLAFGAAHWQTAAQQRPPDPLAILEAAAAACLKVQTIEYEIEQGNTGDGAGFQVPSVKAVFQQARAPVPGIGMVPGKFVARGTVNLPGQKAPHEFALSYDGASFRLLERNEQTVLVIKAPTEQAVGSLIGQSGIGLIGMAWYTHRAPFQQFIKQHEKLSYDGTVKIYDTLCHLITITRTVERPQGGKRTSVSRWAFGVEDHLPRRLISGTIQSSVRIVKINQSFDAEAFALNAPAGYTEKLVTGNEAAARGLLTTGSTAPEWTLRDPAGREHSLAAYRGKIVLLDFWGTWCAPCVKSMPAIQALHEQYQARGVHVFGIAVGDDEGDPAGFMKGKGYNYGLLLKGDGVARDYQAQSLPTVYVIGPDSKIAHAERGYHADAKAELATVIERLLTAGSPLVATSAALQIPRGNAVTIDGKLDEVEWADAAREKLTDGAELRLKADAEFLYVGLRSGGLGWPQLYVWDDKVVRVLHASASLGTAIYSKADGKAWKLEQGFAQELRGAKADDPARAAFLSKHGWLANTVGTSVSLIRTGVVTRGSEHDGLQNTVGVGDVGVGEFKIARRLFYESDLRLAVVFITLGRSLPSWPATLKDDCLKFELLPGIAPASLSFDPAQWAQLKWDAAKQTQTGRLKPPARRFDTESIVVTLQKKTLPLNPPLGLTNLFFNRPSVSNAQFGADWRQVEIAGVLESKQFSPIYAARYGDAQQAQQYVVDTDGDLDFREETPLQFHRHGDFSSADFQVVVRGADTAAWQMDYQLFLSGKYVYARISEAREGVLRLGDDAYKISLRPGSRNHPQFALAGETIGAIDLNQDGEFSSGWRLSATGSVLPREEIKLTAPFLLNGEKWRISALDLLGTKLILQPAATEIATSVGFKAPAFKLTGLDQHKYDLPALRGKVVLLEFWSVACPHCQRILPEVNALVAKHRGDKVTALAMARETEAAEVKDHLQEHPRRAVVALHSEAVWQRYNEQGITPAYYLIDQQGVIRVFGYGGSSELIKVLEKEIEQLLATAARPRTTRPTGPGSHSKRNGRN